MKNFFNFVNKAADILNQASNNPNLPKILGGSKSISIDKIPSTADEFIEMRNSLATQPEGGAVMLLVAALKYTEDATLGRHFLIICTDKSWLSPSNSPQAYKGFDLGGSANFSVKQLDDKKYIPYSYIKGTRPENQYQPNSLPYSFNIEKSTDGGDGTIKVFVVCNGTDTARPITMKRNDSGHWKCAEYSSIFTGVKFQPAASRGAADGDF